jgi:predicted transcriptional regulator
MCKHIKAYNCVDKNKVWVDVTLSWKYNKKYQRSLYKAGSYIDKVLIKL